MDGLVQAETDIAIAKILLLTCNSLVNESLQACRGRDLGLSVHGVDHAAVRHQHLGLAGGQVPIQPCPLS